MGFVWIDSAAGRVCSQFGQGAEPIVGDLLFKLALGEVHFTVKHLSRIPASFTLSVVFFSLWSHCVFSVLYSSFLRLEFPSFLKFLCYVAQEQAPACPQHADALLRHMGGVQVKLLQFHSNVEHSWFGSAAACAMLHHCVASSVFASFLMFSHP